MGGHRREGKDSFMDLKLTLSIDKKDGVVGETDSNNVTTTYIEAFNRMNEGELASHYAHEYTHTLGFQHSDNNQCDPKRDCQSVPYATGNMIEIILTGRCWYGCTYPTLNADIST
jgi:hypothetical protein